ncbi:hypothetical protein HGM15179_005875 [Zosterops borbonicus]|uniref:Uncharacterized protein n=1 Tax=Zosterops borbonicus TaxID=364589 RepID=A0A8K1LNW3_9PASS|nr:hypothetical protein HGM15179_005875 [Zosterops borbonicus]
MTAAPEGDAFRRDCVAAEMTQEVTVVKSVPWEGRLKFLRTANSKNGDLPLPSLVKREAKLPGLELGLELW